jgi:hypothetical protein
MTKEEAIEKVKNRGDIAFANRQSLISMIESIDGYNTVEEVNSTGKLAPISFKAGDIVFHKPFAHPIILLKRNRKGSWIAACLTSESTCTEILIPLESRFRYEGKQSFVTKTLAIVSQPERCRYLYSVSSRKLIAAVIEQVKETFIL